MIQWEYCFSIQTPTSPKLDLAAMGLKGWELFQIVPLPNESAVTFYFKRPKEQL